MPQSRTQSALTKSLANRLIAKMSDLVLVLGYPSYELIYANEAGQAWLSRIPGLGDLTGVDLRTVVSEAKRSQWQAYVDEAVATGSSEHDHEGLEGRRWRLHFKRQPAAGACTAVVLTATDVTALADAHARLRQNDRHYRILFETMQAGVVYHDAQGRVIRVNPAAEAILGHTEAEMIGWSPTAKGHWEVIREDYSLFAGEEHPIIEVVRTGVALDNQLLGVPHPDGRRRWIRLSARPVRRADDGTVENVVVSFHDVTEQQELREQTRTHLAQLDRALEQSLQAMAEMIEQRDPYTAGHQQNVASLAEAIAREMGLDEDRCRIIRLAALVHDIGKNAIPLEILVKPTGLSTLEHDVIKQHVQAGYQVLSRIDFALPIAQIVRQHHERLDGSGYPDGLAGDQILPEARILAVADTVDAMVNHRPYRPARGLGAALAVLEQAAGTHYDPDVVAAFKRTLAPA